MEKDELEERLRRYLPKVADILGVVKAEWGDAWTDWAQGIRDETTALMLAVEPKKRVPKPAPRRDIRETLRDTMRRWPKTWSMLSKATSNKEGSDNV